MGSQNLMLSSNLLKYKIPMLRVGGWGGGGGSWNLMLSSNLLKSKIPMLRVGGGFTEFDVEFKFAKIPNSYVEGGWGGVGGLQNLMLSSNLLKSKIPMLRVGWGGLAESDLDLGRKMTKLKFLGWGGGGLVVKRILVVC